MRGVKGIHRNCKTCGAPFTVDGKTGGKLYCSDKCREIGQAKWREEHKHDNTYRYTPKKPHEITCKRCGKTFMGKWNQRYCMSCLTSGDEYMTKLLYNRVESNNYDRAT